MKSILLFLVSMICTGLLISGCGGGGGGSSSTGGSGTATLTGRIVAVESGGAPNPQASVQVGSSSVLSSATDGSFTLSVPAGTTTLKVDTMSTEGVVTFTIPAASGTEDVGDLWIGATQVTVTGRVVDSSTSQGVAGAAVSFAGRNATTDSTGTFTLLGVAYPTSNFSAFFGIVGNVRSTSYYANTFNASPNTAVGGVVSVADVLLTPLSNSTPPVAPYNIFGHLTPSSLGSGATVTLSQNGTPVRLTTADSSGTYYFWITPGTYTLHFVNGTHTSADQTVTVTATNSVVEKDAVLQ